MTLSWTMATMTNSEGNYTTATTTPEGDPSWLPLAIALPVCLVGIPLVTVAVIVIITCYRSKFRHKNSAFGRKLNKETGDQNEAAEGQNEAAENRTGNPAPSTVVYANLSETVEEAKKKEATGGNRTSGSSGSGSGGGAKSLHWPLKTPWKRIKLLQIQNTTENAEAEKDPSADGVAHKAKITRQEEAETEEGARMMDEATGTRTEWTVGRRRDEATADGSLWRPKANGQALLHVPVLQKNETMTSLPNKNSTTTTNTANPSHMGIQRTIYENRKTFVVMYAVDSIEASHLSLAVNDVIYFMNEEKNGWMKGEKKESGEIGWFPRTHVREGMSPLVKKHSMQVKTDTPSGASDTRTTTTTTTTETKKASSEQSYNDHDAFEDFDDDDNEEEDYETGIEYQALYPYRATEDGDINFDAGDVIVVVEKQDNGWWRGYHGDDHGFFPGSYVQILGDVEFSQSLVDLSQATGDVSEMSSGRAAGGVMWSADPGLLFSVAKDEDVDDDDALQRKQNKKKTKNARKTLSFFLASLPRKLATSGRAGNGAGHAGQPVVTPGPEPVKTKKSDHVVIRGVKKKMNTKTKNDRRLTPMTRRSSLAPRPPQLGPQGAPADAVAKSVMSELAQKVAAEAQHRKNPLNTTYEEIATGDFFNLTRSEGNLTRSEGNLTRSEGKASYEDLVYEIGLPPSRSDVMTEEKSSSTASSSLVRGAKTHDVISSGSKATTETYSNLDSLVTSAAEAAKGSFGLRREGALRVDKTERNNNQQSNQMMNVEKDPSRKPVPPRKPNYIGSTPDIAALSSSATDLRTVAGTRKSPGQKPRPLAKPSRSKSGVVRGLDLELTGADNKDFRGGLPHSQKPKPLKEKPHYLSPGLPQGVAPKSDHHLHRRDIYRSLDSIMAAAEADGGTTDEDDEAAGELGIMKWLQRKLSEEDELTDGRGGGGGGAGNGKPFQQMQTERTRNNADGRTRNVEQKDGARIVLMIEGLSKAESFV